MTHKNFIYLFNDVFFFFFLYIFVILIKSPWYKKGAYKRDMKIFFFEQKKNCTFHKSIHSIFFYFPWWWWWCFSFIAQNNCTISTCLIISIYSPLYTHLQTYHSYTRKYPTHWQSHRHPLIPGLSTFSFFFFIIIPWMHKFYGIKTTKRCNIPIKCITLQHLTIILIWIINESAFSETNYTRTSWVVSTFKWQAYHS